MLHNRLRAAAAAGGGIPTDGLVAHYTMDNVSGTTLVDEMGNYNGTIYGSPAFNAGIIGNAIDFAGNSGYVDFPGMGSVILDAYSFWFYTPVDVVAGQAFEIQGTLSTSLGFFATGEVTGFFADETFSIFVMESSAEYYKYYYIKETIPAGWHHIVFNWTGSTYEYWMDDVKLTTYTEQSGSGSPAGRMPLDFYQIGKRNSEAKYSTKKYDHIRIYSNSGVGLTSAEISALYKEVA